ncbi:hypothetical protein [Teredinibacter haidensis]|uniref:hypothetical protein n=1 Tax=Teredinibacter haidensis TaxID=2731755 RepID=UPI000948FA73|nr:hypothetical protein [Teredinibacter haidensis]
MKQSLLKFTCCCLLAVSFSGVFADSTAPLSNSLLDKMSKVQTQLLLLADRYPELENDSMDKMEFGDGGKSMAAFLKGTPVYKELLNTVEANGFTSLEEFTAVYSRVFVAMLSLKTEQLSPKVTEQFSADRVAEMKKQLLSSGLPEEMIDEQVKHMTAAMNMYSKATAAAKNADPKDIQFVRDNAAQVAQLFNDGDDEGEAFEDE